MKVLKAYNKADKVLIKKTMNTNNKLNDLSGKEWIQETKSIWHQKGLGKGHPHAQIERLHPAPFSFQDVGRLICFFTKEGGYILDPFVGVASTLKACAINNRRGLGLELIKKWVDLGKQRLVEEVGEGVFETQEIRHGDARKLLKAMPDNIFDFVVTSPPYWKILTKKPDHKVKTERISNGLAVKYSDDDLDLGNIEDYQEFLLALVSVFKECHRTLKDGKYLAIIVSDFRHKSKYVPFHSDLAYRLENMRDRSFELQGITILFQNHKKLYPYGYPTTYVPNIHHQYILILRKPIKKQKERINNGSINK